MVKMTEFRIIATFMMCIFFNVFLNSFDHYSDVTLAYETLNFDLGNSLLLSGCRVCHGKTASDIYSVKKTKCQKCVKCVWLYVCLTQYLSVPSYKSVDFLCTSYLTESTKSFSILASSILDGVAKQDGGVSHVT